MVGKAGTSAFVIPKKISSLKLELQTYRALSVLIKSESAF